MTARELDGIVWRKSSYSGGDGECVEIGWCESSVAVRDSKYPTGPTLSFPATAWRAFTSK
jgi:hypothetical protein